MEKNQKINCTVSSCAHNNVQRQECQLEQIVVTPTSNNKSKKSDESKCSSYKNDSSTEVIKRYEK